MKSKTYILSQIQDLLVERHGYTVEKAQRYTEVHKNDKVYELLVLKKSLSEQEQYPEAKPEEAEAEGQDEARQQNEATQKQNNNKKKKDKKKTQKYQCYLSDPCRCC